MTAVSSIPVSCMAAKRRVIRRDGFPASSSQM